MYASHPNCGKRICVTSYLVGDGVVDTKVAVLDVLVRQWPRRRHLVAVGALCAALALTTYKEAADLRLVPLRPHTCTSLTSQPALQRCCSRNGCGATTGSQQTQQTQPYMQNTERSCAAYLVVRSCALQPHDGVVIRNLCKGGLCVAVLRHLVQRIFPPHIALRQNEPPMSAPASRQQQLAYGFPVACVHVCDRKERMRPCGGGTAAVHLPVAGSRPPGPPRQAPGPALARAGCSPDPADTPVFWFKTAIEATAVLRRHLVWSLNLQTGVTAMTSIPIGAGVR